MFLLKIFTFALFIASDVCADEDYVVEFKKYGKVRGKILESVMDKSKFVALRGVPYVQPIPEEKKFMVIFRKCIFVEN